MTDKFELTTEGYLEAKQYLKDIGVWEEYLVTTRSSVDGYSIVHFANSYWSKQMLEKESKPTVYIIDEHGVWNFNKKETDELWQTIKAKTK